MAGRYSKEYRPNEFVKLPFEEVAKVMAMKEQQYQQGYLAHSAYQQEMGKQEDRAIDVDYSNFLMNNAKTKVENLVADTYGGDYGAGASDILRTLSNEANNPYYKMRKKLVEGEKLERDLEMKLNAEGKALAFKKDYTNKAYWDNTNNRANTDFKSDIQGELQHDDEMMKAWKDVMTQQQTSNEQSYEQAYNGGKGVKNVGNKSIVSQKTTGYHGISPDQYKHDQPGAYQRYKQSTSYKQLKRQLSELENNGKEISDEQADTIIRNRFNKIGEPLVQWDPITSYKETVIGNAPGYDSNGNKITEESVPMPEERQDLKITKDDKFNRDYKIFKETTLNKFKPIAEKKDIKRQEILNQINSYNKDYINRAGVSSTDKLYATREVAKLRNELSKLPIQYSLVKTKDLTTKEKNEIVSNPIFYGMRGLAQKVLDKVENLEQAQAILEQVASSIKNNSATMRLSHKMKFNSEDERKNVIDNVKVADVNSFDATDEGGGDKYNKSKFMSLIENDPNAQFHVRGDGKIIFYISTGKDKDVQKTIALDANSMSVGKKKVLKAINEVENAFYSHANINGIGDVSGDVIKVKTPIVTEQGTFYPKVTPGGISDPNTGEKLVEMVDKNGNTAGFLTIGKVIDSYHREFLGTSVKYNLSTNIYGK